MAYKVDILIGTQTDRAQIKKVETELDALYKKYQGKNLLFGDANSKDIDKTTSSVKKFNTGVKSSSKSTKVFGDRMKEAVNSTLEWSIAVGGLYKTVNKLKEAVSFTTEFDTALTTIAMVTNQTRQEVDYLKDDYLELAEALKVSSVELANSAVALYRQGLATTEVNARLETISKTAKVTGLSVEEVTKAVTSSTNAMGVTAENATDVMVAVASAAATNFEQLSEGLQKSASSLSAAGFDIEESAAIIGVLSEVTQESASSLGTSVKSIIARFNKLNDSGEDNAVVLNQIDEALRSVGLSLSDSNGQLKDVDVVLRELAPKWDTLTKNQQAYLTTQIAGARQANRFLVIMENYNRVLELQDVAYKSAGTTQEQYVKFQESIQGKINELVVAWEKFYDSLVDEGTIADFLEFAIGAVNLLTELNEGVGIINIAVAGLTTKIILFVAQLEVAKATTWAMVAANEALKASLTFGVTLIGTALVGALIKHNNKIKEAKTSYEELSETLENSYGSVKQFEKQIENLNILFPKQSLAIKNLNRELEYLNQLTATTSEEEAELASTKKAITDEIVRLKSEMGELIEIEERLATATRESKADQRWNDYTEAVKRAYPSIKDFTYTSEELSETVDDIVDSMSNLSSIYDSLNDQESISVKQMFELIRAYPEYAYQIATVNDSKESGKRLTELLFDSEKKRAIAVLEQEKAIAKAKLEELKVSTALMSVTDPYALSALSRAYSDIYQLEKSIGKIANLTLSNFNSKIKETAEVTKDSSQEQEKALKALQKSYQDMTELVIQAIKDQEKAQLEMFEKEKDSLEDSIKAVEEAEREKLKIRYETAKDGYEAQKNALQKEFDEAEHNADKQERLEEISALESKLLTSLTEKERYDIQQQVADLRKKLADEELKYNLDTELAKIDAQLKLSEIEKEAQIDAIDEKENAVVESTKVKIYWEGEYTDVTVEEARKRLEAVNNSIEEMENSQTNYAEIAENIMMGSSDTVLNYLKNNLEEFKTYTMAEIAELQAALDATTQGQVYKPKGKISDYAISGETAVKAGTTATQAHQEAQDAREYLMNQGFDKGVDDISQYGATGASDWYDTYIQDREDLSDDVKDAFKQIVDSKEAWNDAVSDDMKTYHTGGIVGDTLFNPKTEQIAKLQKGEMVLTRAMQENMLGLLSSGLPNLNQNTTNNSGDINVKIEMSGVTLGNNMDINKTAQSLGSTLGTLIEVQGIGTQRIRNSRR